LVIKSAFAFVFCIVTFFVIAGQRQIQNSNGLLFSIPKGINSLMEKRKYYQNTLEDENGKKCVRLLDRTLGSGYCCFVSFCPNVSQLDCEPGRPASL
jgi:hypothetical protein